MTERLQERLDELGVRQYDLENIDDVRLLARHQFLWMEEATREIARLHAALDEISQIRYDETGASL